MQRWILLFLLLLYVLLPGGAQAQEINLDLSDTYSLTNRSLQLILLITVLSVAPGILITITCFPFIVTVFSILRQAIGLQQSPPNMLLVTLAMFLTFYVMEPTFSEAWENGIKAYTNEPINESAAFENTLQPFHQFMAARVHPETYAQLATLRSEPIITLSESSPISILIPAFMLSELSRAFQIGFLIYLPFLIIDLVVAAILMSMGMMMVPPVIVSLPFKLAFFVVADGWVLLSSALVSSY